MSSAPFLNATEAAERLGVSAKALLLYERRGLLTPKRTAAGWRVYGPVEMARGAEIVGLRALGLSLAQVARVLGGDAGDLEPTLAAHQATLEGRMHQLAGAIDKLRQLRTDLARGATLAAGALAQLLDRAAGTTVAFDLPWPWGGERFELGALARLTYITGPLGSGKTRLAERLAATLPDAGFVSLDRSADDGAAAAARLAADAALKARVDAILAWLIEDGATLSPALTALLVALDADGPAIRVVDMVEQGLDQATQEALIAHLRHHRPASRPLLLLTRSTAILDLAAVGPDEAIIFCPANHSPPMRVAPCPGAAGYEAVASCLASPAVRARTAGVIAVRSQVA